MSDNVFKIFNLQKVKKKRFINFTIVKIYLSQTTIETRILLKLGGIMRLSTNEIFYARFLFSAFGFYSEEFTLALENNKS